jgi:hypothetical protein
MLLDFWGNLLTHPLLRPQELLWVAGLGSESPKNYQIWHHRRSSNKSHNTSNTSNSNSLSGTHNTNTCFMNREMVERLGDPGEELVKTGLVLEMDSKNYHAW